ncbi:DUF6644 family protein [Dyadobacter sandarakinus]|uniref:DUF6644 domain-containing protein n=1 Tax=Dyadobacter sandarakinus TaxID=2747268 RepID=A0ABX7I180_9BACT|nr:DUF6644 family protein [Dyadobacter sandarakinus]QRQ99514.1 hypothetical protein HWI92_00595 [Dyadobacter sandarakinus]
MEAELLTWLEKSSWAVGIRQSLWLYPALEIVHILGIVMLAGAAFLFDLRLLGYSRNIPVTALARHVLPWSARGLILIVPSGLLLFITNAQSLGNDPVFWTKLLLIVLAGINAAVFHQVISKKAEAMHAGNVPAAAKIFAVISLTAWIAVIACGRLLAY